LTSTDWSTFNGKQAALVSGTNIKTINGQSVLGSGDLSTNAAGGAITINTTTIGANYTFPSGVNGVSVGPITVASGVTVTVTSGQRWVVL
jgi:hypothetical protein